ncbi:hypothetical protein QE152_g6723 [Popillia japonica]|uniref:Uncharacterized protein n=1 Tax=Popillia japonica TaxID=7064 RepID=A0AAW1MHC0_POPJA
MEDHDDITDSDDEYVPESETDTEDGMKIGYSSNINDISAHTTPSKARKRKTNILEWKINKKKILRTAGKEYKSGKKVYRETKNYRVTFTHAHVELPEAEAEEELVENAFNTACTEGDLPNRPVNVPSSSFATPKRQIENTDRYPRKGGYIGNEKKKQYEKCDNTDSKAQEEEN